MTLAHEIPARSIVIFRPPVARRHHYRRPDPQFYYSNRAHRSPVVHTSFQRGQPPPATETLAPPQDFADSNPRPKLSSGHGADAHIHSLVVVRRAELKRFSGSTSLSGTSFARRRRSTWCEGPADTKKLALEKVVCTRSRSAGHLRDKKNVRRKRTRARHRLFINFR